ncbi:MAG: hypothetical protein BWY82_02393 [Verrucomicrobia bacterium ADurb.Bin474]|nr:MAG: hypothetical protein BWY82_02393 [Verrucomicrobia bacterium ADurb.Bin474]
MDFGWSRRFGDLPRRRFITRSAQNCDWMIVGVRKQPYESGPFFLEPMLLWPCGEGHEHDRLVRVVPLTEACIGFVFGLARGNDTHRKRLCRPPEVFVKRPILVTKPSFRVDAWIH